ncbi:hypothetical protein E5163_08170 [Marinicauda algicola]|uniref:Dienelactone hydrolase domain-containing protein n=1 Tax=Marinicauda algicola TaxID=2029849 RepID=A0A4S2H0Y9_9PROT|nr:dienelactone hydrolase family protein [Marinicauda algicola]TGY89094.1 hypothetical protein E5163_08170 [Marinicauda algicola]
MKARAAAVLASLALAGAVAGFALAPARGDGLAGRIARLQPHVDIQLPEGADGPAASVLLFSGCGGVQQVQQDYADAAKAEGVAAVIVDSHAARGIGRLAARLTVCTALRLRGQERAGDVLAALEIVRADERLDPDRVALAGWSHGGWTLLDAASYVATSTPPPGFETLPQGALSGVAGMLLIYPYCGGIIRADSHPMPGDLAIRAWLVERDAVADPDDCKGLFEAWDAGGARIRWTLYPGLTHAFDAPDQPWDPRMEYDAQAARDAHARFREWLAVRLAPETGLAADDTAQ